MGTELGLYLVLGITATFVVLHSFLLLALTRAVHELRLELGVSGVETAFAPGSEAPAFSGADIHGASFSSSELVGRPTALLFISAGCDSCATTLEETQALGIKARGAVVVVCRGTTSSCAEVASTYSLPGPVIADVDGSIGGLYSISKFPTAVLIDRRGRIRTHGSPRREEIVAVVEEQSAL
ncbi:MAG: hypothetical protein DLM71_04905 [Chloroflexi bacterium]|nr:TlpA family protein disulfide reductase [Candidatus Dormibacteraeota bacterium]PZR63254.1 MAG: hypothetical protein DLM71_04905 [Chloroflexota bacterium]